MNIRIDPIADVIADFAAGKMVIIVDDADRENEGDLTVATEMVTAEQLNFMLSEARGLICVSISSKLAEKLELPLQVSNNSSPFETPFSPVTVLQQQRRRRRRRGKPGGVGSSGSNEM